MNAPTALTPDPLSPTERPPAVACVHCGLPVPGAPAGVGPHFCCAGCRSAWQILNSAGLGDYYRLREATGAGPSGQAVEAPAPGRYAHFDDPGFIERFGEADGTLELHVEGLHCAACVWVLEQLPQAVPGIEEARVDFGRARIRLRLDPTQTALSRIADFMHGLGYRPSPLGVAAEQARRASQRAELLRLGVMAAITGNIMLIAFALYAGAGAEWRGFFEWTSLCLAIPAVTYGAWPFYRSAWGGLRLRTAHIDLPISIGILAGFLASVIATARGAGEIYFDSVSSLVFLLLVGRFVQGRGQRAAMNQAELLAALTPGTAWRRDAEGAFVPVPAPAVSAGDVLRVRSGETFPVDGRVLTGQGHADLSLLTGESRPVPVGPGGEVFAGTVALGEALLIEAAATGPDSRLGRLVRLIETVDADRAPIARLADKISGRFVVTILSLAVLGGIAWGLYDPSRVFGVVVSLLVVTCPCALGLATPVALAVARGRAAAAGILVRSSAAIERLARVDRLWFDKTGTLTTGRLSVLSAAGDLEPLRPAIAGLERRSVHPVARAIAAWAGPEDAPLSDITEQPGTGIAATLADGRRLALGSPARLGGLGPFAAALTAAVARGETPVLVQLAGEPVGLLTLGDDLRPDALEAMDRLRALGLELGLLSGDHPEVVAAVAARLHIQDARGGQDPEAKAAVVAHTPSVMVGDGFNDAAALRAATVGIAVHGGAEVAMQVADLFVNRPGPGAIADAVEGARRTLGIIRRNLGFSLAYNVVFASLALAGLVSPLAAAILMPISSLTVIASSVLGQSFTPPPS